MSAPLDGLTVIDLSRALAGPHAGMLLGDMGARVTKVPQLGPVELPGPPLRLDDNAYAGGREQHIAPPHLGQHNESVRAWLDLADAAGTEPERRR